MSETIAEPATLPHTVTGTPSGPALDTVLSRDRAELRSLLAHHGALLFRGFPVDDIAAFETAVRAFSGEPLSYQERSSPRHSLKGNVYTSTDYPPDEEIFLHNENSYQAVWPRILYFYCDREPDTLGATPLADIRRVYEEIEPAVRDEFARRGWMVVRNYQPRFGVAWPEVFGTDDRGAVERYCADHGMVPEWVGSDHLRTRAVRNAVYRHPDTGQPVWFNHITFFHHTSLDEDVREGLLAMFGEDDLPTNTYYGDGGRIPDDVVEHLRSCYRRLTRRFDWKHRDVLVVDNMAAAHGREPFTGPRKIAVAMGEAYRSDFVRDRD
ncbi:TauD/TfdA family dioxygenase [Saccharomonospora cyanea]|uniref:Putative taurine catabolism dioxygenase n=1 Tax=Saccharomonospora cyanea NA-134 TaxID=882082 RepID=H5XHF4_9PSEU|nr:TauD/TfdA family dioxygenase [Saccharomonospora cyanea]EHR60639.1 putative taurine catabolism dioxygenase [Saccharomonospora cyanea NA-134]